MTEPTRQGTQAGFEWSGPPPVAEDDVRQVARAILGANAELVQWKLEALDYNLINPASGGLHRLAGLARLGSNNAPFSAILKVAVDPNGRSLFPGAGAQGGGADDLRHHNYFLREYEAYRSGLLEGIPGISAPALFGSEMRDASTAWLWLEEVAGQPGARWPFQRFQSAARHLAHMNAAWFEKPPPPSPWTTNAFLRSWTDDAKKRGLLDRIATSTAWSSPLIQAHFPVGLRERLLDAWRRLPVRLATLAALPSTTCHLDAHAGNLFAKAPGDADETVALDWAFVGAAAFGEELGPLVVSSTAQSVREGGVLSEATLPELREAVLDSYMAGLADAGNRVQRQDVETAFAIHSGYRYQIHMVAQALRAHDDPSVRPFLEWFFACPFEDALDRVAIRTEWTLGLLDSLKD